MKKRKVKKAQEQECFTSVKRLLKQRERALVRDERRWAALQAKGSK